MQSAPLIHPLNKIQTNLQLERRTANYHTSTAIDHTTMELAANKAQAQLHPSNHYRIRGIFKQVSFSYNSNNQQSNENNTYLKISLVIERIDQVTSLSLKVLIPRRWKLSMLVHTCCNL